MKLKTRLMICTAALALTSTMAQAAIDPNALANTYLADSYTYVEVKTGPTQTKVEAVKDGIVTEVIYDNETGAIVKSETEAADDDYIGRVGVEFDTVDEDFEDDEDEDDDIEDLEDLDDEDDDSDEDSESDSESDGESDGESDSESGGDDD